MPNNVEKPYEEITESIDNGSLPAKFPADSPAKITIPPSPPGVIDSLFNIADSVLRTKLDSKFPGASGMLDSLGLSLTAIKNRVANSLTRAPDLVMTEDDFVTAVHDSIVAEAAIRQIISSDRVPQYLNSGLADTMVSSIDGFSLGAAVVSHARAAFNSSIYDLIMLKLFMDMDSSLLKLVLERRYGINLSEVYDSIINEGRNFFRSDFSRVNR